MIVRVVPVLTGFEERAELDRLVRFVVVHRTGVEPGEPEPESGRQGKRHDGAHAHARHLGRP